MTANKTGSDLYIYLRSTTVIRIHQHKGTIIGWRWWPLHASKLLSASVYVHSPTHPIPSHASTPATPRTVSQGPVFVQQEIQVCSLMVVCRPDAPTPDHFFAGIIIPCGGVQE